MKRLLILIIACIFLAGCNGVQNSVESGTAQEKNSDIGFAWYATAPHPFFEGVKLGVEGFEKDYGIRVSKNIGPDWKQDSEIENMEVLAAKGYRMFSVYPVNSDAINSLYDELSQKGCRIVNFGADIKAPTKAEFYVGTDIKAAAETACEELIRVMGGKGNIINVLEVLEDSNTAIRRKAIIDTVAKHPGVRIIQEVADINSVEQAIQKINDSISANLDDVDGIIATGDTTSDGVAQVLTDYRKNGGKRIIHSVGINTDPIIVKAIKDGVMDETIAQNSYGMGYISCLLLKYLNEGWRSKSGTYTAVNTGIIIANNQNIDSVKNEQVKKTEEIKISLQSTFLTK